MYNRGNSENHRSFGEGFARRNNQGRNNIFQRSNNRNQSDQTEPRTTSNQMNNDTRSQRTSGRSNHDTRSQRTSGRSNHNQRYSSNENTISPQMNKAFMEQDEKTAEIMQNNEDSLRTEELIAQLIKQEMQLVEDTLLAERLALEDTPPIYNQPASTIYQSGQTSMTRLENSFSNFSLVDQRRRSRRATNVISFEDRNLENNISTEDDLTYEQLSQLEDVKVTLTENDILQLPCFVFNENSKETECSICLCPYEKNDSLRRLPCLPQDYNKTTENIPKLISLHCALDYDEVSYHQEKTVNGVLSIVGVEYETEQRLSRAPLDVVAVIDRSSSMVDDIHLVKRSLMFLVNQMKEGDRLGVVIYNNVVDVILGLTSMNAEGKDIARLAIERFDVSGATNISGGLLQALDMLHCVDSSNLISSILLFTDGRANIGITATSKIKRAVENYLNIIPQICSIFTFGFGEEVDPEYLTSISDASTGMYYHIQTPEDIPVSFADCIGGLLSTVGQQIIVTVETEKNIYVDLNSTYKYETLISGSCYKIYIDDIYSEEQKDILLSFNIPSLESSEIQLVATIGVQYTNAISKNVEFVSHDLYIKRTEDEVLNEQNMLNIDKQKNRILTTEAMLSAIDAAKQRDYSRAKNILVQAQEEISKSPSSGDPFCTTLIDELQETQQDFVVTNTESPSISLQNNIAVNKVYSKSRSHARQRAIHTSMSYVNSKKNQLRSRQYTS
eukprot:TRINITY_DN3242_c0_g1_i3.p1 TRINITY_DN3242_c0_g1~~TRINITY_DN3242_c0_g1_i3.p1  ORF type:complete len:729 (+),score=118.57 TRINITY_DN3242_c0_g1_i3:501-2687(+)